jgi:AcrR family transcriptional regulator
MEIAQPRKSKVESILDAAMQEFLVNGYSGTSLDQVAKVAGVSKATVYSYFQYKELLFKALIERLATERFHSTFGTDTEQVLKGEPAQALAQFAHRTLDNCKNNLQFQRFIRVLISESERFPELAKTFIELRLCCTNTSNPCVAKIVN